jgi:hypothetical protein
MRNLAANTPGWSRERLAATRDRMNAVLPEAGVADYRPLIADLTLPDPDDRHVLAAATAGQASVIVTWNLKDFPARHVLAHGVTRQSPDDFLTDLHAALPDALISSVRSARLNLRRTNPSAERFIDTLQQAGLRRFSTLIRVMQSIGECTRLRRSNDGRLRLDGNRTNDPCPFYPRIPDSLGEEEI